MLAAGANAACEVAAAEAVQDGVFYDDAAHGIGHDRLEPLADFNAHLALVRCNDEQDTVVLARLTDAPVAAELVAEVFYGEALERG